MNISRILPIAIPVAQLWVRSQRKKHRCAENARSLTDRESAVLLPFFTDEILRKVRVTEVSSFPSPWFYPLLRRFGIETPLDIAHAGAITFDDTIVIVRDVRQSSRDWYALLFHEVVHVVQYTFLGLDGFIDRYLRGLVAVGMDYYQNPFEREAYTLQNRFQSAPHVPFSVEAEVRES